MICSGDRPWVDRNSTICSRNLISSSGVQTRWNGFFADGPLSSAGPAGLRFAGVAAVPMGLEANGLMEDPKGRAGVRRGGDRAGSESELEPESEPEEARLGCDGGAGLVSGRIGSESDSELESDSGAVIDWEPGRTAGAGSESEPESDSESSEEEAAAAAAGGGFLGFKEGFVEGEMGACVGFWEGVSGSEDEEEAEEEEEEDEGEGGGRALGAMAAEGRGKTRAR